MALRMLELEEEKEEAESQAAIEAALVQREKFLSKNRQASASPSKRPKNADPQEVPFDEDLGKSGKSTKSINLMGA